MMVELLDATQHTLQQQIQTLAKEGLRGFREARRDFWRGAESLEAALTHNAEVPRRRVQEAEEAGAALRTARAGYRGRALDYALQINVIEDKRKFDIMEFVSFSGGENKVEMSLLPENRKKEGERGHSSTLPPAHLVLQVLRLVEAQATYFQQGHEELSQLAQYRKDLGAQLHQLVLNSAREKRDMEQRHVLLKQKELGGEEPEPSLKEGPGGLVMEGHLFKRASNAFKTWSRRWFTIQSNQLVYQKKYKDPVTVVVDDLRLCTVKLCPDSERRFCFEVVSTSKSCLLQADSERLLQLWISAVQSSIASAFSQARLDDSPRGPGQGSGHLALGSAATLGCGGMARGREPGGVGHVAAQVQSVDGNAQCCDCREPAPEWASINLGVTLCIQCSGIHRSLGVHFSKVRSLTLDSWEPELVKLMCELGNVVINQIYEARVEAMAVKKPGPTCSRLACLFLKRGADLGARDSEGRDPLTIAMETTNADIVTLLRLAKMREAEAAQGQTGDETYLDIFRDFSLMASDDPEKLSRRSYDLHTL
ncbi:Arf-GAP with coiled-coil, ANK repeat and PH domain-containing protein 1 [Sciurus carolinensis]|uniref:Arf-GAP with coiled-coil, ANK repeat and PH domain-containing protein n=1 Tax=Sciurus carolinensis TaxID=30640 RepID=A0AA41T9N6_SCICA|nr:Arf-GAP with coiled-coil, ANK repeat and PH domain-containing protein 1 [Sciurus carolinensis]